VSCAELDTLVGLVSECAGVEGARMTGAGFGGAIVALVWPEAVIEVTERVAHGYAMRFGSRPKAFVVESRGGAVELE
jgi:galactokinase